MQAGVIGLGNLGTALAQLMAENGHQVVGWEYHAAVVREINEQGTNTRFLPNVVLHPQVRATTELAELFDGTDAVFVAVPSVHLRGTLTQARAAVLPDTLIVNAAKGIERDTGLTALQVIEQILPHQGRVMLSGPTIANEFARRLPTVVMLAGPEMQHLFRVARLLDNNYFRVRFSNDALGVELGGVLKNAYVIGLGLFDGKQIHSVNFRSVYLTLALEEMTRIGVALGARPETFAYLPGMGDLLATALSEDSHNRRMGRLLAAELPLPEIERTLGTLPEGFNTIQALLLIAEKLHVSAPLAQGLWDVINSVSSAEHFIYNRVLTS